jgi:glycine/D-amino acid oxidase-like deaminating enzyme
MPTSNDVAIDRRTTDVVVIGDGIIGLSTALELERRGARCIVFGAERPGVASLAAAGLLAPSIGQLAPSARSFFEASLALYPALLEALAEFDPDLALMTGLLVVSEAVSDAGGRAEPAGGGSRLSPEQVRRLEPGVRAPHGADVHPSDGAVDNVRLMAALRRAVEHSAGIQLVTGAPVSSVDLAKGRVTVMTESGAGAAAPCAILAAGAWSPHVRGLPRPLPVAPLKGQMLALDTCPLDRPVVGNGVYLVPRGTETVVGSTSEDAGFDVSTTPQAVDRLRAAATAVCPALGASGPPRAWAGLRPATPDMLPILGPDPDHPELLYATGHSRNGILLAPATAAALADLAVGRQPSLDLSGFGIARFGVVRIPLT